MKLFLNEDECRGAVGIVNFVSGGLECLWRKSEERKDTRPNFMCARARTQGRTHHVCTHARTHARMRTRTLSTIYHACPDLRYRASRASRFDAGDHSSLGQLQVL